MGMDAVPSATVDNNDKNDAKNSLLQFGTELINTINPDIKSVEQGASTQVWLASDADEDLIGGNYYDRCKQQLLAPFALNANDGERLWNESEELVGRTFDLPDSGKEPEIEFGVYTAAIVSDNGTEE